MPECRLAGIGLLIATFVLAGCATSRSEVQLTSTAATRAVPERADAPTAIIRTVKDERTFEQAPKQPSTPSLGFEGAAQATSEAKLRAIGRKRNTYGMALGDVFLQPGHTVESVVRDNLTSALRDAGYNVRTTAVGDAPVLVIDVQIKKFWAWLNPGFWAITVNTDIATDMKLSTDANSTEVSVHVEDGRALVTDSAWIEVVDKALQEYRREVARKLPVKK